jgi:hypothetical protein
MSVLATRHNMRVAARELPGANVFAYCLMTGERASGDPNDYPFLPDDRVLVSTSDIRMVLVRELYELVEVDAERGLPGVVNPE